MGCKVGGAARPVAAANQDLSLSPVTSRGSAVVWRVWLERSATAAVMVTIVTTTTAAQVGRRKGAVTLAADRPDLPSLTGCDLFS